ncbi:hypothetical protein OPV22_028744 [Ensete ventricosum]|uniref:Pentacotripeptide-repeat region of PRORP domain-containing protein n=1 Tax=Ensete ventricosum TaxID=4639 RepID=A0AAV8PZ77_ENSVE|nr:hypothetical protein OPV22_028744 [Ensete ventricosum]
MGSDRCLGSALSEAPLPYRFAGASHLLCLVEVAWEDGEGNRSLLMRRFPPPNLRSSLSNKFLPPEQTLLKARNPTGSTPTNDGCQSRRNAPRYRLPGQPQIAPSKPGSFHGVMRAPTNSLLSSSVRQTAQRTLDPARISAILCQKDWFLMLNSEFQRYAPCASPRSVVSLLQNLEEPLSSFKFYVWVSNFDEKLARDRSVRMVLIDALWRKGPVVLSVDLLNEIRSCGCRITEDILCILFSSWGRLGLAKYVNEVFGQLPILGFRPTTRVYNSVIESLVRANSLDLAYFKFQQMPSDNCLPDLVACALKSLRLTEVCKMLDEFVKRGGKPGFSTYIIVVESMLKEGLIMEADRYLKQMVVDGCLCSVVSYNTLIDCFVKSKMMDKAMEALEKMHAKGFLPNLITFNTLVTGFSKAGDVNMARNIVKMLLEHGLKPDVVTFSTIIDGLCEVHQMNDAFDCFIEMVKWGVSPNAITYNILIRSLCEVGNVHKSMVLFKRMKSEGIVPDIFSFNALILSFCRMKKLERARNLFNAMLRFGVVPDIYTYNAFIRALCDAWKIEEAKETLRIMELNGITPNSYSYGSIVDSLLCMGHLTEAQEFISKCERKGIHLSSPFPMKNEPENVGRVVNS